MLFVGLLILIGSCSHSVSQRFSRALEKMDTMDLIRAYGMDGKDYKVVTEDGYELEVHRMMVPRQSPGGTEKKKNRLPILLQHGMLGRSDCWVLQGPRRDLAFLLAENGYDVWLGNVRGNQYCKSHVNLSPKNQTFWEFSWHEMGYYDLPATIDLVLRESGAPQLIYIGHSMGTTIFFVMSTTRPEYNEKVRAFIGLAPEAFFSAFPRHVKNMAKYRFQIHKMLKKRNVMEFPILSSNEIDMCRNGSPSQPFCIRVLFYLFGRDYKQLDTSILPILLQHGSGASLGQIMHYAELIASGGFHWFNHGPQKNLQVYGSEKPPEYNLSLATVPSYLFYGPNDKLCHEKDVMKLAGKLPNVKKVFKIPYKYFNHIDFLIAKDVVKLLYTDIMHVISKL